MEIIIVLVVAVAVGAVLYFNRSSRSLDINKDGQVDAADAVAAVQNTAEGVTEAAKKAAVRAKTAARSATKKPAARKTASKPRSKK